MTQSNDSETGQSLSGGGDKGDEEFIIGIVWAGSLRVINVKKWEKI